ncbi:MAG: type II secretion system protein [Syntrophales bacterium]|nr:type II secretion system protein [Syntrophales bacterium]
MKRKGFNKKGFTMIELITAIVIISIVSVMAGMGLVQIANAYLLAKKSTVGAQQAQIALARLSKELAAIETISAATETSITYKRIYKGSGPLEQSHTLAWTAADQPLTLDGDTLIDKVQDFSLTYLNPYSAPVTPYSPYSSATTVIHLTFQLKGYGDIPLIFVKRTAI